MRTMVVGAGATGGYFGARLAQAGRDVTFLVPPRRAAALAERGLRLRDPAGRGEVVAVRTVTAGQLEGAYDVVLLAVKAFALEEAIRDVSPAVGEDTVVVPFLNGMRHLDRLVDAFAERRVYGGVCLVATMLDGDGGIVQLNDMQQLRYGPLAGDDGDRASRVQSALSGAGFGSELSSSIVEDMWEKWVLLASLGAITCLMRGTVGAVNAVPGGEELSAAVAREALAVAAAAGHPARLDAERRLLDMVTAPGVPTTSSMYRDLSQGLPVEGDAIIGDLTRRARSLGVDTPRLDACGVHLGVYERGRAAGG